MSPFERREILYLERCRLDKLITLALKKFPWYLLLRIVALLIWTSLSEKSSLELSLILLEVDKLGLSLIVTSEFVKIIDVLLTLTEEGASVNKLIKFKISGEKLSQKFFRSVKKVKSTDTHQYLHASSCHISHSKKSIPFSQAMRLNRVCSESAFLDKRCNELEL